MPELWRKWHNHHIIKSPAHAVTHIHGKPVAKKFYAAGGYHCCKFTKYSSNCLVTNQCPIFTSCTSAFGTLLINGNAAFIGNKLSCLPKIRRHFIWCWFISSATL